MSDKVELLIYNGEYQTKIIENGKVQNSITIKDVIVSQEYEVNLKIRPNLFFDCPYIVVVNGIMMGSSDYQLLYDRSYYMFTEDKTMIVAEKLKQTGLAPSMKLECKPREIFMEVEKILGERQKKSTNSLNEKMAAFGKQSKDEKISTLTTLGTEFKEKNKQMLLVPIQEKTIQLIDEFTKKKEGKEEMTEEYLKQTYEKILQNIDRLESSKRIEWLDEN